MSVSASPSITADEPSVDERKAQFDREFEANHSEYEAMEDVSWNCTIVCSGGCY